MYNYEWDSETGGYILLSIASKFSKEPRPVYYKELDILGFDKFWKYKKDDSLPYMWAESNSYIYKGKVVAKTKGGSLYTAPELDIIDQSPEGEGNPLQFVNINLMIEKNKQIMDSLVNETIKRVFNNYYKYKDKIDVFYVAFSGGKDSIVLLDIVQKSLPHNNFLVMFGDTKMENSDTYALIPKIKALCKKEQITFLTATANLNINSSWNAFGYPSQKLRWCCCVHKTSPQIMALRKYLNKDNFKGMAFVGVRRDESITRSKYETISEGEKHEGQYNFNVIDEWNSAELFLYIYENKLLLNESYKKGNSRVGCLVCPMSSGKHEYMKNICYPNEVNNFISLIKTKSNRKFDNEYKEKEFIENGGWKVRNNGRDISVINNKYIEEVINDKLLITIPKTNNWEIWIKTLGEISTEDGINYSIVFQEKGKESLLFYFIKRLSENTLIFELLGKGETRSEIRFKSLFRSVMKKSAYCIKCGACEANCPNGCIKFEDGLDIIGCEHCMKCHNIDSGCLLYNSIKVLKGVEKSMSLDSYASFGVEKSWVEKYLKYKEDFWYSEFNDLGSMKITALKRFLRDSHLKIEKSENEEETKILHKLYDMNLVSTTNYWGIILSNLVYTPQLNWFVKNTNIGEKYLVEELKNKLGEGQSKGTNNNIITSLKNMFTKTPLGVELKLANCELNEKGNKLLAISRLKCSDVDGKVILYSLYKFAEECGDYYQFTLTRLMNFSIESDGVSPAQIFGIDRDKMEQVLTGLSINYPEFISATFTLDLDNITLRSDKTSLDVLKLF